MIMAVQLELRWSEGNSDSLYSACKSARCSCLAGTKQWKGQKGPSSVGDEQNSSMAGRFRAARYTCSKFQIGDLCQPVSWIPNPLTAPLRWSWYHTSVQILIVQIQLYMWVSLCVSEWPLRYSTLVVGTKHMCSTRQLCWYIQNSSPLCELVVVEWITSGIAFI